VQAEVAHDGGDQRVRRELVRIAHREREDGHDPVAVDVGAGRIMWSSAQVTNYEPDALVGSLVVCVCNFAPKNIAGFTSELLILGAKDSKGQVIVLSPRSEVAPGEPVY